MQVITKTQTIRKKYHLLHVYARTAVVFPLSFMFDNSMTKGLSETEATWAVSIIGITNTIGRVLVGLLGSKTQVSPQLYLVAIEMIATVSNFADIWFDIFPLIGLHAAMSGLLFGEYQRNLHVHNMEVD